MARKTKGKGFTQSYMAKELSVSASTYSDWESSNNERLPSDPNVLLNMCFILGINCHYLLTGTLITEKDDMALARMNTFFYRSTHDGEFNALIRRLEKAPKDAIKAINTLLEFDTKTNKLDDSKKRGLLSGKKEY